MSLLFPLGIIGVGFLLALLVSSVIRGAQIYDEQTRGGEQ